MTPLRVAIYARVSSEQQAGDTTIASQIAALEARLAQDRLPLTPDGRFTDEGYRGATLVRPALERLRDRGARRATLTSWTQVVGEAQLAHAGLRDLFARHSPRRPCGA